WRPTVVREFMLREPGALVGEIDSEYTLTYLSQKDKIDRAASIPEIRLARPGLSVFTRQATKFKIETRGAKQYWRLWTGSTTGITGHHGEKQKPFPFVIR